MTAAAGERYRCAIEIVVTNNLQLRFTTRTMLIGVFFIAYILAAFSRGNHLLGVDVGILYAVVATYQNTRVSVRRVPTGRWG